MIKFDVLNRRSGEVQFTAEINCDERVRRGVKLGLAVLWALINGANLRGADLYGANLRDADLRGAYLRGANLRGADLYGADLRNANLRGAYLRGANLRGADLYGANLRGADLYGADLRNANLRGAYLRGANLRGADLYGANLRDADLYGANLRNANLRGAYLRGANLRGANLRGANLRGADLCDVPRIENIHQTVYAAASQSNALEMSDWHTCETTHCRAGWVTTLAGEGGAALERDMGTSAAAAIIYMASDPFLERIPDFYASNAEALEDMKRLAEAEAAQ